jgi:TRAP-type C4-dicarboxylate transport system substrate-binding protein
MLRRQGAFFSCFLAGLLAWSVIPVERVMAATNLVLSHLTSPIDPVDRYLLRKSADYVAKKSNNQFTITIYPAGELGTEPELQYQRAVNGTVDIALGLAGFTPDQFPGTMVAELPGFAPNAVVGTEKLLGAMDLIKDEYKKARLLALWTSDRAVLMMGQKVVRTMADLKGLKMGVLTKSQGETMKALGATPEVLPETALYRSLQTGYVDGLMVSPVYLMSFDLGQVAKTYTVGPFPATVFFLVMNHKSYNGLNSADKALLDHATGIAMSKRAGRLYKNASAFALGREEKAGKTVVRLSPEEEKKWLEATAPVKAVTIKRLETKGINAGKLLSAMGVSE